MTPSPHLPSDRRNFVVICALFAAIAIGVPVFAQTSSQRPLKKYNVTVRRFNPTQDASAGEQFILPVDSPDPEHAISAAMSNVVAFTTKTNGSAVIPVAFICTGIAERK